MFAKEDEAPDALGYTPECRHETAENGLTCPRVGLLF